MLRLLSQIQKTAKSTNDPNHISYTTFLGTEVRFPLFNIYKPTSSSDICQQAAE